MAGPIISIIVPVLNEAKALPDQLDHLLPYQRRGCEILFVDGGSQDGSADLVKFAGFDVLASSRGRARQMNVGAQAAMGDILLFLHVDTKLPSCADNLIHQVLSDEKNTWGRFDVRIDGKPRMLRLVAFLMNLRSRITGIATGDQAIFVRRSVFESVGMFSDQPLMEDIELSRRLRSRTRPVCLKSCVVTSGRRWEAHGVWRTILLMWRLRLAYWLGTPPETLAKAYR